MLDLYSDRREAELDIDACHTCKNNWGWTLVNTWGWSEDKEPIELMVWFACADCNDDEHKPKPWDT